MYNRLIDFLEKQKILYEKQFGFRKRHSTYMALMILIDKLIKCMENGEFVIGVFLDFYGLFHLNSCLHFPSCLHICELQRA